MSDLPCWGRICPELIASHAGEETCHDGCSPRMLVERAEVKDGLIAFPGGTSYRVMVLPQVQTMTPALLKKIRDLVKAGATIVGNPPLKSPSLSGYPACDEEVQNLSKDLWGGLEAPAEPTKRTYGQGAIHWGGALSPTMPKPPKSMDALTGRIQVKDKDAFDFESFVNMSSRLNQY